MKYFYSLVLTFFFISINAQNSINKKVVFLSSNQNGVFDSKPVASHPYLKFFFKTNGSVRSTPGILNGKIYFGSGDGYFYCLDSETGNEIWKFNSQTAIHSSPDFENGNVYFSNKEGILFCLNSNNGKLIWKLSLGKDLPYKWEFDYYLSSPSIDNHIVYVGSGDGNLYAVNSDNGKILWKYNAGSRIRCKPLIAKGFVIFGDFAGRLHALDIKSQNEKWLFESAGSKMNIDEYGFDRAAFVSSPTISGDKIFIGSRDGVLYAVDVNTGKKLWEFDDIVSWIISSPTIYKGKVFTGTSDGKFINAVDADSGKEVWRTKTDNLIWSSASLTDGILYYGDYSGNFFAANSDNGEILWKFKTGDIIHASSIIYNQTVYFGSDDGYLYAISGSAEKSGLHKTAKKAVYWEDIQSAKWLTNKVDEFTRDYFVKEGYALVDSNSLKQFFEDRINDHLPSIVILVKNYAPANVYADSMSTDPVRKYLDAGGKIVMLGPNPFAFKYNRKTLKLEDIDFQIPAKMFGIKYMGKLTDAIRGWLPAYPTLEGNKLGLKGFWLSTSQAEIAPNLRVLAKDETGFAAAWIKKYSGPDGTGLVQFWVNRSLPMDLYSIYNIAEWGLQ